VNIRTSQSSVSRLWGEGEREEEGERNGEEERMLSADFLTS
jgi:hypothetical protein